VRADDDAFRALWDREYELLLRRLRRVTSTFEDAEDAAQEAMARAHRYGIDGIAKPAAWLFVAGRNAATSAGRAEGSVRSLDALPDEVCAPAADLENGLDLEVARGLLTERQQTIVTLRYDLDLTTMEIAAMLDIAEGTVRATVYQSVRRLRVLLGSAETRRALRSGSR